jgi:ribosome biogenesis GTPase A
MLPKERYEKLKEYLSAENPVLLDVIDKYADLDKIAHKNGLLAPDETYTSHISWWPMISVLGTFSAGKSSFINKYLGHNIQESGNQAVDDKFTVICYGGKETPTTLPGLALDADPRFPFYNISEEVNKVDPGEGNRVNLYMQLKTLKSEKVKGRILIDSPGFDADSQRDGILRITSHIVDMSDLVLIFFDARHPEPGAMRDTLEHLVGTTLKHRDANKVLYILNQIDSTAKEDNLEAVISSWQRALSREGLVSGNFYGIYNEEVAGPIEDPSQAARLSRKSTEDFKRITDRMDKVSTERAYRIIKALDDFALDMKDNKLPIVQDELRSWSKKVFWLDMFVILLAVIGIGLAELELGFMAKLLKSSILGGSALLTVLLVFTVIHTKIRNFFSRRAVKAWAQKDMAISNAIARNTRWWKPMMSANSQKWASKTNEKLIKLMSDSKMSIQKLNDQFISPSGN